MIEAMRHRVKPHIAGHRIKLQHIAAWHWRFAGMCASGPQGAIAVGTPTERSGARSHAVARMARRQEEWEGR